MGTDIKLKDLFGQTQTEQDISTVSVPKADGTGREFYVKRLVIYYRLVASPPYAPQEGDNTIIFWNLGDGGFGTEPDIGNCMGGYHEAVEGKTTKPIISITVSKYMEGIAADNSGKAMVLYLYEALEGATLLEVLEQAGTADFTAQPGWGQLIQGADGQTYTYTQLTDLSSIAIGIEQPNTILNQRLFYSFLMEKTNSAVAYTATKNGDYTIVPPEESSGISAVNLTVDVAGGGGTASSAKWNDVTFIDYDGSILYSYSLEESQELTELPALPSHDGLVSQGWNWTLEAIKALNRPVTVGAMYITDDGATRLHIRIATIGRMTVPLYIGQTVANGVSIDWGDGSTAETLSGTGNVNTSHTYAEPGDYVILLMPTDGCALSFGTNSSSYCVMGSTRDANKVYCNMLQDVSIGKNVTSIGDYAFYCCHSLASVTIPTGVTSIGNYTFYKCYSLASVTIPTGVTSIGNYTFSICQSIARITIPDGVTSIGNNAFSICYSLASITIPDGVTSIGNNAFSVCYSLASITIQDGVTSIGNNAFENCYSLASITIPDGVTSIGNYAFGFCYGMRYYDFSACTAIPALSNTDAFISIPSDCQMLIPSALYNDWKSATNWKTYASKMVSV